MTVEEIKQLFNEIGEKNHDALDAFVELAKYTEEYNNSNFSKITGMDIYRAYSEYYRTTLRVNSLVAEIQDILNSLDYTQLENTIGVDNLFAQIPDEYKEYFKSTLEYLQNNDQ